MPELPDVTLYVEAIQRHIVGQRLAKVIVAGPSLLKTVDPPTLAVGLQLVGVRRIGKRIALEFAGQVFLVFHLMISGRLRWRAVEATLAGRSGMALFVFETGALLLTEAGSRRRASLHVARGADALAAFEQGGIDVLSATADEFRLALGASNHTLKRALTDPRIVAGIGNAYSDEILHRARLSPVTMTTRLSVDEIQRLHAAARDVLQEWTVRLRKKLGDAFPEKVTAFHKQMMVHGQFGNPCPVCSTIVQRIRRAKSEVNYCPTCQTKGRLLRDRSLSLLLRKDWPSTWEEMESRLAAAQAESKRR